MLVRRKNKKNEEMLKSNRVSLLSIQILRSKELRRFDNGEDLWRKT